MSDLINHERLKEMAEEYDRPLKTLTVLQVDPFAADAEGLLSKGQWFADLYTDLDCQAGLQLRAIHYLILSQREPILMHDGTPYQNTLECFLELCKFSLLARYNDLIPDGALIDRRNSEPIINMRTGRIDGEVSASTYDADDISVDKEITPAELPALFLDFGEYLTKPLVPQRYIVEVWIEKSTMSHIVRPLCQHHHVNLVEGIGEMSEILCANLVKRVADLGMPVCSESGLYAAA